MFDGCDLYHPIVPCLTHYSRSAKGPPIRFLWEGIEEDSCEY